MSQTKITGFMASAVFAVSFAVYFLTAARLPVNIADSNELMTAAVSHGVAHPPSYPLYVLILQTFMQLPGIPPAFAANLSSALFQSLSLALLFLCSVTLIKSLNITTGRVELYAVSLIGVLTLAFSYFFWDQATYAEVFGLNNVFAGVVLWGVLKFQGKFSWFLWVVFGLAAAHHQTILFLLPAYLFLEWIQLGRRLDRRYGVKAVILFSVSFMIPYTGMLAGANRSAPLSWYFEPSLTGFWNLINRGIYAQNTTAALSNPIESVGLFIHNIFNHFTIVPILISGLGLGYLYEKKKDWFWFFTISLALAGPALATYVRFPVLAVSSDQMFYHGTYLSLRMFLLFEYVLLLLMPLGILSLPSKMKRPTLPRVKQLYYLPLLVIPVYLLVHNFSIVDKSRSNFDSLFYTNVLESLPHNSMVMVDSDLVFGLLYQQVANNIRSDVLIVPTAMHMRREYLKQYLPSTMFNITGYYELILTLTNWGLAKNIPVFVLDPSPKFLNQIQQFSYQLTPHGYTLEIAMKPLAVEEYDYGLTAQLAPVKPDPLDLWSRGELGQLATIHMSLAYYYHRLNILDGAQQHFDLAQQLSRNPRNFASYLKLLNK